MGPNFWQQTLWLAFANYQGNSKHFEFASITWDGNFILDEKCKRMFQVFSVPFWPQSLCRDFALEFMFSSTYLLHTGTFWLVAASAVVAVCRFVYGFFETGDLWDYGVPCEFYQRPCSWPWTNPWRYEQCSAWWPGETSGVCCWILFCSTCRDK